MLSAWQGSSAYLSQERSQELGNLGMVGAKALVDHVPQ
jgi:hypothetical protein